MQRLNKARQSPFARLLVCEECGRTLRRIQYPFNNEYILTCKNRSKDDENYIECSSEIIKVSTLENITKLVVLAIKKNHQDLCTPIIDSLISNLSNESFVEECKELESKFIEKQNDLNTLLKNQVNEDDIGSFDAKFSAIKEEMKIIKFKIKELKELAEENHELQKNHRKIMDFLEDNNNESLYEIRQLCSLVVHRKNGSLRFVLKNPNLNIDSFKKIKKILRTKPIFTSTYFDGNKNIEFDIVAMEKLMATFNTRYPLPIDGRKLNVCAYARVSTDKDLAEMSLETQIQFYTTEILKNDSWEYCGVYADEGITEPQ